MNTDAGAYLERGKSCRGPEAAAALHKALELDPQNCSARIELGSLYEDQDKLIEAAAEFKRAIAIDPNHGGIHCQLGRIFRKQGRWSEAEAILRKALEIDPRSSWACVELGTLYQGQDRISEAVVEFEKAIATDGNTSWVYCQLGRIYRKQGRWPEAEAALQKALEFDPQDGGAHIELGGLYQGQDRFSEAAAEFERVLAVDPGHGGTHCQLGRIYRKQGRWSEAEAILRKALEIDPRSSWARVELGTLYQGQDRISEAAAEFEKAIATDGNNGWVYCQLGQVYRKQGRWPEAESALRKALEFDPQDGGAHIELGGLYQGQDRFSEAAAEFERAVAKDGKNGGAHYQLGTIYRRLGRLPEAEAVLRKALELDPRDAGANIELGVLYEAQSKLVEAVAEFERAIAIDPNHSRAHCELGATCRRQGRSSEAEAALNKALELDPRSIGARSELGAYLGMGHSCLRLRCWAEAATEFQRAAALDPRNVGAHVGLWAAFRGQGRTAEAGAALAKATAINPRSASDGIELLDCLDRDKAVDDNAKEPMRERVFCLLPWTQLYIRTDGSLHPCASWSGLPLGNARSSSLAELRDSPGMKVLRADMMSGRPTAGCWRCYTNERSGLLSRRQKTNAFLGRHRGREFLSAPDGTLLRQPVLFLEFHFSNVCNLRCRTCDATQSSAWAADARALGMPVEGGPIQRSYDDWDSLWRQLQPLLEEGIEIIHFIGGEPLLMEEHYRILDYLIARGRTDVRLRYNTNFSTLRFQGRDVIELWTRFSNVLVSASLDGSGRRGEYLRKGLSWDAVVANREEMLCRCPDVAFSIATTVSIFNALHLPDFHREWVEKGYIDRDEFRLNMLLGPAMYRMQVLPPALKERVLESYRRHQESFLDAGGTAARDFATAAHLLQAQDCSELLPGFVAMTRRLDELRGEDCREVFPELAELFEAVA